VRDAVLAAKACAVFVEHEGRDGSPCVWRELCGRGDVVVERKVAEGMREPGLVARRRRRFRATTDPRHHDPIAPNLLERHFSASAPNEPWVTDVTALWTHAGWLFVAAILDLYCQRVVGWAASANHDRARALDALRAALVVRRSSPGWVHHEGRGSPYASADDRHALERAFSN